MGLSSFFNNGARMRMGATLRIDALPDTLVSPFILPVMGAALSVVALETDVIVSPIRC